MVKKNYLYTLLFFLTFALSVNAQENNIDGLSVFPNPNNTGKVYITTKQNLDKKVEIFDVLGKKVIDVTLYGKELNISALNPGVYIIKIREEEASATRKLIIN
jgi:Secretion system C-terminal sorting domain